MQARARTLFTYDTRGRMVCRNDPEMKPAPRLFLAYTSGSYTIRFGQDISDSTTRRVQEMIDTQPALEHIRAVPPVVRRIQDVLGQRPSDREGGPAYRFQESLPPAGKTIQITGANVMLARDTFPWLVSELVDWWPCFAVVCDGAAVSVCFSARIGSLVCEAGVESLPAFRRRGYAAEATAAWAAAIRDSGRTPLYSTSRGNIASQSLARRLGLIMFGADVVWT